MRRLKEFTEDLATVAGNLLIVVGFAIALAIFGGFAVWLWRTALVACY